MGRNWQNLWGICFTRRFLLCRLWMPEAADAVWPDFQWQESSVSGPSCKRRASQNSMRWNALCEWYDMIVCLCVDWCLLSIYSIYCHASCSVLADNWNTEAYQRCTTNAIRMPTKTMVLWTAFCSPTEWDGIFSQFKTPTGAGFWVPAVFWRCGKGSGKLFEANNLVHFSPQQPSPISTLLQCESKYL